MRKLLSRDSKNGIKFSSWPLQTASSLAFEKWVMRVFASQLVTLQRCYLLLLVSSAGVIVSQIVICCSHLHTPGYCPLGLMLHLKPPFVLWRLLADRSFSRPEHAGSCQFSYPFFNTWPRQMLRHDVHSRRKHTCPIGFNIALKNGCVRCTFGLEYTFFIETRRWKKSCSKSHESKMGRDHLLQKSLDPENSCKTFSAISPQSLLTSIFHSLKTAQVVPICIFLLKLYLLFLRYFFNCQTTG